ncbi:hypothetical protein DMENIID0001_048390 [Sergentomyia squamirostris]
MVTNLLNVVKNNFLAKCIKVDEDWITGCVEWVEIENPSFSAQEIFTRAFEQWLLVDLSEAALPCLPPNVSQKKEPWSLTGKFALQINYIVDISESFYDQWRRLNDEKTDEPEPTEEFRTQTRQNTKRKRLLKLELSDGNQTIDAMEYCPIACLNTKILPGCKIILSGPVQCVNSVLLLTPNNVKILGGEVDTLLVPNAYENILLKNLDKPLNPTPRMDYQVVDVSDESERQRSSGDRPVVMATFKKTTPTVEEAVLSQMINEDDDFLAGIDLDVVEADNGRPTTQEYLEFAQLAEDPSNEENLDEPSNLPKPSTSADMRNSLQDFVDDCLFEEDFNPSSSRLPSILDSNYKFRIRGINLVTIDQFRECLSEVPGDRCFILRARVCQVVEKLVIQQDHWNMGITLVDIWSKEPLKVRVLSSALNKLAGMTARELTLMYEEAKNHPQIRDNIMQILSNLKDKLQNVDCFMKIDYTPQYPCAALVDFIDPAPVLNSILREKVKSENLKGL